jgi:hydroxymethylbilane synthase
LSNTISIGTRGSQLALWQANWVKEHLIRQHPNLDVEIQTIKTTGDKILDVPLAKVGGKGLFVKDPRDAVLGNTKTPIMELPEGARIGTSSLRRQAQLFASRPDFVIEPLRGNINTRLRKLKEGMYDAIILAMAGVSRLGWEEEVTEVIEPDAMLPAIGQGALGIEARLDDQVTLDRIAFLNDDATSSCVTAERAFLHRLEGGCQVPIAAYAVREGDDVVLTGLVASVDGKQIIKDTDRGPASGAIELGNSLAGKILDAGGREILEEVYCRELG